MPIYILSATQISIQEPLSEAWMQSPIVSSEHHKVSIDPDFRKYVVSKDFRRIGKLIKRALTTSIYALNLAHNPQLDAVISGTGVGCLDSTEKFLLSMIQDNESFLTPTHFIYSTHNTLSSQIALHLHCHGYNNTYSQQGTSFDDALYDAYMQLNLKQIATALIGGFDEFTSNYFQLIDKTPLFGDANHLLQVPFGESSVSMVLSNQCDNAWCQLQGMKMLYRPTAQRLQQELQQLLQENQLHLSDIDTLVLGINGVPFNDEPYQELSALFPETTCRVAYKSLFGEGFTLSAIGLYVAAAMLHLQTIPQNMVLHGTTQIPKHLLFYNHFQNRHHSLILLSSC